MTIRKKEHEMTFGEFYRSKRERIAGVTEFAKTNNLYDSHVSCYESGAKKPPVSVEVTERHARALGLEKGTSDWYLFYELAAAETGRIPAYVEDMDHKAILAVMTRFRPR